MTTCTEIAAQLRRWGAGELDATAIKRWVEGALARGAEDRVAREALAELDLLEVHLLTTADVPALLGLVESPDGGSALAAWAAYRAAIDLDARSKELRKIPFYRPFCR